MSEADGMRSLGEEYEHRLARVIAKHPNFAGHLRASGYGSVLPRLRARHRPPTEHVVGWAVARMSAAAQLLTWTQEQGLALDQITQAHMDQWLAEGSSTRHNVRDFMVWAADNHRAPSVLVPHRLKPAPVAMRASADWGTLLRCLRDEALPMEVRTAGAIVLFYGQQASRVVALRSDSVRHRDEDSYLLLGEAPVLLPPPLARLIADLSHQRLQDACRHASGAAWLFPHSRNPTEHRPASLLTAQLNSYGIHIKAARAAALMNAALDAPVFELSAKLGIHRATAAQWKRRANRDRSNPLPPSSRSRMIAVTYQPPPLSAPPADAGVASIVENALRATRMTMGQRAGPEIAQGQGDPRTSRELQ
ncbi:hypothetical protein [Streptomyces sp. NPDC059816]|uniref:hypothetical protein n=1 Tax=Streptomyces sp. NPDC059816 TaxID=3346960 RepID=UPI003663505F